MVPPQILIFSFPFSILTSPLDLSSTLMVVEVVMEGETKDEHLMEVAGLWVEEVDCYSVQEEDP